MEITALLSALNSALAEPLSPAWSQDSPRFLLVFTVIYAVVVIVAVTDQKNTRPGAEHGSAAWGDVFRLNKFYMDKRGPNLLLTQHFHIGIDGYKHKRNTNILIVGGSGAGKTRTYGVPNVLECACSMVITDPKAEILRKTGNLLKQKGYEVIVFDLINPAASFCYNPFVYVHDDREVLTLIENLIRNTTPSHSKSSDPFWEKSETALLQALMLYLLHEAPPEEQNFPMVMEMIAAAEVHEDDDNYQSPLDILFERLEMREPDSIACKQYRIFKQAAGKTAKSILVSVGVRLAAFNLPSIAKLTMTDELHLQELGERKIALFCNVEPDCVIQNATASTLYEVPLLLEHEGLCRVVCRKLHLDCGEPDMTEWRALVDKIHGVHRHVRIALVGKYVGLHDAYLSVVESLFHAGTACDASVEIQWVDSGTLTSDNIAQKLCGCSGILVPGGFGDRGIEGMILAAQYARERGIPYLGICLGMQIAVIEFARHVLSWDDATSAEFSSTTAHPVIALMPEQVGVTAKGGTMRLGKYPCVLEEGSLSRALYDAPEIWERHRHRYEFNNDFRGDFTDAGMRLAGLSPDGTLVEIVESKSHPWFVGAQFHPEFKSRPNRSHPLFKDFIRASLEQANK